MNSRGGLNTRWSPLYDPLAVVFWRGPQNLSQSKAMRADCFRQVRSPGTLPHVFFCGGENFNLSPPSVVACPINGAAC